VHFAIVDNISAFDLPLKADDCSIEWLHLGTAFNQLADFVVTMRHLHFQVRHSLKTRVMCCDDKVFLLISSNWAVKIGSIGSGAPGPFSSMIPEDFF